MFLQKEPLLNNPGFQLFCSLCSLNEATVTEGHDLISSEVNDYQQNLNTTNFYPEAREKHCICILFLNFQMWHFIFPRSSSIDTAPNFCVNSKQLHLINVHIDSGKDARSFKEYKRCCTLVMNHVTGKAVHRSPFFVFFKNKCSDCLVLFSSTRQPFSEDSKQI